jgi:hypothetical protein
MKVKKCGFTILLGILLLLILSQCSKYKEEAPFFDGLYLEYKLGRKGKKTYNVSISENKGFKIIETEKYPNLNDEVEEYLVDNYGKVYKSSSGGYKGYFSPIWIPANEMKAGDTFGDGLTVSRVDKWKKWEVLVVKVPIGKIEVFYEINSGFWVGTIGRTATGATEFVLFNTNADIPVSDK